MNCKGKERRPPLFIFFMNGPHLIIWRGESRNGGPFKRKYVAVPTVSNFFLSLFNPDRYFFVPFILWAVRITEKKKEKTVGTLWVDREAVSATCLLTASAQPTKWKRREESLPGCRWMEDLVTIQQARPKTLLEVYSHTNPALGWRDKRNYDPSAGCVWGDKAEVVPRSATSLIGAKRLGASFWACKDK